MTIDEISEILWKTPQNFPGALAQYLAEGRSIDARNWRGWPLIVSAAGYCNLEAVKLLLEHLADVNNVVKHGYGLDGYDGYTALNVSAHAKDETEVDVLLSIIDLLVQHNANINAKNKKGDTPLHHAAWWGYAHNAKILKRLIEHHADVNLRDCYGNTAILYAARHKNDAMVRSLINAKADLEVLLKYPALYRNNDYDIALSQKNNDDFKKDLEKYRPKLFEILKEYNYIIPTPSSPYDPETQAQVDKHNASIVLPKVDEALEKSGLYTDLKNIVYAYLYSVPLPKSAPAPVSVNPPDSEKEGQDQSTAASPTESSTAQQTVTEQPDENQMAVLSNLKNYINKITSPHKGTYYGRSNQIEKIEIAKDIQDMLSNSLKPDKFLDNLKTIHAKIRENKDHTGNPILHLGYGNLNKILEEAKELVLNSVRQEKPYGHSIAELAEYIQNAEENKVEKRSTVLGLRTDQVTKLAAAREILELIKPGSQTDVNHLKTKLIAAIDTNRQATVKTPFKGQGKLDSIFQGLLKEINTLPKPSNSSPS